MANIFDVAREAGVSIKTVSRVLNHESLVRESTRKRVRAAMDALDYKPSGAARELRTGRSRSIGMLFGDPSSGFQARVHAAALQACNDAGYFLTGGLFDEDAKDWAGQVEGFLARAAVDRMILVPPLCDSTEVQQLLVERGVDFVVISPSRAVADAHTVRMDDRGAAKEITEHLLGLGHRRIAHIAGPPDHAATSLRRDGFEAALAECPGAEIRPDWIQPGLFRFRDAIACAERLLASEDRPTAIFAANDEMAAAVYFTAHRLGLSVPEDLSVAGFDDVAIATTIWPPLTTIAQPFRDMAEAAVSLLTRKSSTGGARADFETVVLGYTLKARQSAAPPAGGQ